MTTTRTGYSVSTVNGTHIYADLATADRMAAKKIALGSHVTRTTVTIR